jgi:hypothetical protein
MVQDLGELALWSDEQLDAFRGLADPVLDPFVSRLDSRKLTRMLGTLFSSKHLPHDDSAFEPLLAALPRPVPQQREAIERGQALFRLYGPEVLLILGCYGLPAAYAAAKGVQVIYRARRLKDDPLRRLCDTAQMVINVMQPGALESEGIGTRSLLKVRLMHALVRQHVKTLEEPQPWSQDFGEPINQEDLTGTLLTFSILVLDGLRKIGVELQPGEEHGYLEVWKHIGAMLGIDPRLIPADRAQAELLSRRIAERQFRPSTEGRELAGGLAQVVNGLFPISGYGLSLSHFFLDRSVFGLNLAEVLALPPANWTRHLVRARATQKRFELRWLNRVPGARRRRRSLSTFFAQALISLQRPDERSPFEVPPALASAWRL